MAPVTLAIVGAGNRGWAYARFALANPELARVVAVAEPRAEFRDRVIARHEIEPDNIMTDWRELADRPRLADAVIVATQDADHVDPAITFARAGYAVLLEKPIAPTAEECKRVVEEVTRAGVVFAVCHVMRYTPYTRLLKSIVDAGTVGQIISVDHLEPVGFWHQAHSFVRGNWRREDLGSPMLLAKSCHDLDWLRHIVGSPYAEVSSFGSLRHFRPENAPAGSGTRCLECAVEPDCAYSAPRLYLGMIGRGDTGWPVNVLDAEPTEQSIVTALKEGPYGRCVYHCDNDVVDNQVVSARFEDGTTATFTMTGFAVGRPRETRIFGTRGELYGDGEKVVVNDFLTGAVTEHVAGDSDGMITSGHGGGDDGVIAAFVEAVSTGDRSAVLSGPAESLETHLAVFAAEKARLTKTVVAVPH